MSPTGIALRYVLFAATATGANLAVQWAVLALGGAVRSETVVLAIAVGTLVGLGVKYHLDRRYIFRVQARAPRRSSQTFALYAATGGLTTLIFWGAEALGALVDPGGPAMYLSAAVGLGVGYGLKYRLDRRFTFGITS